LLVIPYIGLHVFCSSVSTFPLPVTSMVGKTF
jgi:hypothetical protein